MASHKVQQLASAEEFTAVVQSAGSAPVVVDFFADWCGPCVAMKPVFEQMATEFEGKAIFCKVNIDEVESLANQFGIQAIPTFIVFKGGVSKGVVKGANAAAVKQLVVSNIWNKTVQKDIQTDSWAELYIL